MFRVTLVVTALVFALVVTSSAAARVFTIRGDWKMGSFAVKRDGTLRGAIDAFGQPTERIRNGEACTVRWKRHGLRIGFYNLGGNNPCQGKFGFFSNARAKGPHWVTNRGLEIGDGVGRLQNLYPNAKFHPSGQGFWPSGWWLVRRESPFAAGSSYPGLLAHMHDSHVQAFHVRYPAGGD